MDSAKATIAPRQKSIVRWLAAGLFFMGVNTGFLYLLVRLAALRVVVATVVSAEICTVLRFILNEWWVFGTNIFSWRRLWQYHLANGGAFLVWWAGTNVLTGIGLNYIAASILAVSLSTGFSFASNFFWIWRKRFVHGESHTVPPEAPQRRIVAGIVLLRSDGAALLQLRDETPAIQDPGIWVVPGGHVERDETPRDGASREFLEETCYRCSNPQPLASFSSTEMGYPGDFDLIFFWERYDGVQKIECREGQALKFVGRREAENIPRRDYLTEVWDMALSARSEQKEFTP
jgi:8-oxo-dGTP pyrophosphatase MutT (NUDIX family)